MFQIFNIFLKSWYFQTMQFVNAKIIYNNIYTYKSNNYHNQCMHSIIYNNWYFGNFVISVILTGERSQIRFCIPEATYKGNWEIVKRIFDRNLLHYNFTNSWAFPCLPPPFVKHGNCHHYLDKKIDLNRCVLDCYLIKKISQFLFLFLFLFKFRFAPLYLSYTNLLWISCTIFFYHWTFFLFLFIHIILFRIILPYFNLSSTLLSLYSAN